ncbi:flagellar hook-associated protein FlgL [Zoogloea sp.]|uniref:flagellar hook-associated protein FlgL n=1 Tax=Zoogloea sp. TaxID=49181 RepID=UPI0014162ED6|nr:MAG: flagellar hook-associated protein 3 [Zoogloea sp.]
MRITTGMIFDKGVQQMQRQNSQLLDTQQQVATGRRILSPSDDPVASARALEVSQSQSVNKLYASNQGYANDALRLVDSKLGAANDLVTYVRTRAVESGNGTYTASDQASIADDLAQQFDALQSIANSKDSTGDYVFAGYRSNAQPFVGNLASGVSYQGDQGTRTLQISETRNMPVTSSGDEIFNSIRAPVGSAFALSGATNTGSALVSGTSLGGYNGHAYAISVAAGPTYQVFDSTADPTHSTPITPTVTTSGSNTTLSFGGVSMTLSGTPAAGDSYSLSSVASSFDVLGNFVTALNSGNAAATRFNATQTIAGMDASQDSINEVRSGVGARMVEVEAQQNINGDLDLQYSETLSRLQDADYAESVSNLSKQQILLQAAQQSFMRVSNLSLFNYLN